MTAVDSPTTSGVPEIGETGPLPRIPVLYLAPWVDFGGSDKGTIDWFRWLDRDRFAPSLITTQPSDNRRLREIYPFAEEVWALPDHFAGHQFPRFIFDFIHTRGVRVLHIMNSRLGYELLPDLAALDSPPRVVVQLHVEESDRSGYVRYVTTRYGNLVDAFSVTSEHLARAVEGYEVPRFKIHVIPTGVDGADEFSPERVRPLDDEREPDTFSILFAGRLTEQKDPMLMVEVVRWVAERHGHVRVDVVGDGLLEGEVRARVRELGLGDVVRFHPSSAELARWLRSSDLLLMTSVFEGVPYVVYEALAMGVPIVAPGLPGNVELMGDTGGRLIADRRDAGAYADAVHALIEDPALRGRLADAGRERMLESFSLRTMAAGHETVYDDLLRSAPPVPEPPPRPALPPPLTFSDRPATATPLVSIVTPCFNHGRYLQSFLGGLDAQDYPALEAIIVDDGSTDAETIAALAEIERAGRARVIRQPRNRGPSVARNRAASAATGRYILPVDADNILRPGAVSGLVAQLQAAGEQVGFIYPSFQYFGTRDYRFDAPAYNLFALLRGNFVDTCSLLDREIFDAGLRYAEDIELGHEDWDLALELAARAVVGEPTPAPVMLYRKQGFTRSDLVEYLRLPFSHEIRDRHPELFGFEDDDGMWGRHRGPGAAIKARWNPALSLVLPDPVDFASQHGLALLAGLGRQTCRDFELIAECPSAPEDGRCVVRRLPPELCGSTADRVQEGLDVSRGRYLMVSADPARLTADPTAVEKLVRGFAMYEELEAVALTDLGIAGRYPFRLIEHLGADSEAHAIAWRRELHHRLGERVLHAEGREVGDLAERIHRSQAHTQWRHFPGAAGGRASVRRARVLELDRTTGETAGMRDERKERLRQAPAIPAAPFHCVPRWGAAAAWMPPETLPLVRHREGGGERRMITNDRRSPPGFQIEFDLGSIQRFSPPGTVRLLQRDGRFTTAPRGSDRDADDEVLGYLEQAPLPLFGGIELVTMPDGSETLALSSERDPVYAMTGPGTFVGFIEMYPSGPYAAPGYSELIPVSLVRLLDREARRHRYAAVAGGETEGSGVLAAELGELLARERPDLLPLWSDDRGRLSTDRYQPPEPAPTLGQALRWAGAPAGWRGFGYWAARPRAVARRLYEAAPAFGVDVGRLAGAPARSRSGAGERPLPRGGKGERRLLGYLHREPGSGRIELFAATHPVLDDQFVTHHPLEATDMGYDRVCSLGFIEARAPVTGALGSRGQAIPWVSRFGLAARQG